MKIRILAVAFVFIGLGACKKPIYETETQWSAPSGEKAKNCVSLCQKSREQCSYLCKKADDDCQLNNQNQAQKEYDAYVSQQNYSGLPITRDLNSFYDPLKCTHQSCQCEEDYRVCYQLCGGKVTDKKRCVANCDKQ